MPCQHEVSDKLGSSQRPYLTIPVVAPGPLLLNDAMKQKDTFLFVVALYTVDRLC